ncbi:HIT domain-containing protein [uncultured Thiodictyon sp.]|nr:HIT domain-containing protein [uncultured Thiodictyon sp.]
MSDHTNCVFCGIVRGDIPAVRVHEDEQTLAFMDIQPASPGHT